MILIINIIEQMNNYLLYFLHTIKFKNILAFIKLKGNFKSKL